MIALPNRPRIQQIKFASTTNAVSEHETYQFSLFAILSSWWETPVSKKTLVLFSSLLRFKTIQCNLILFNLIYSQVKKLSFAQGVFQLPENSQKCRHILLRSPYMELNIRQPCTTHTNRLKTAMKCAYEHPLCTRVFFCFWPNDFRFTSESALIGRMGAFCLKIMFFPARSLGCLNHFPSFVLHGFDSWHNACSLFPIAALTLQLLWGIDLCRFVGSCTEDHFTICLSSVRVRSHFCIFFLIQYLNFIYFF